MSDDNYTKLLLHMDGSNESTTFTDSCTTPKTVTPEGNAKISTAQAKFSQSGLFDSSGDYLTLADSDDWFFSTGDFTIDFWIYFNGLPSSGNSTAFIAQTNLVNTSWGFNFKNNSGTYQYNFYIYNDEYLQNIFIDDHQTPSALTTGTWYHIELTKSSNTIYFFRDGKLCNTGGTSEATAIPNVSGTLYIASSGSAANLNAYLDEFRITKGLARHTSDFTPPTEPYALSTSTANGSNVSWWY